MYNYRSLESSVRESDSHLTGFLYLSSLSKLLAKQNACLSNASTKYKDSASIQNGRTVDEHVYFIAQNNAVTQHLIVYLFVFIDVLCSEGTNKVLLSLCVFILPEI